MRTFSVVTGALLLLFALLLVGVGALVLADADSNGTWSCTGTGGDTYGSSFCSGSGGGDTQYQAVGLAFVVGGAAAFLSGCVLLAGITAAGPIAARRLPPMPASGPTGPAPYGGGGGNWQGSPAPGGERS